MATVQQQADNVRTRFKKDPSATIISEATVVRFLNEAQDMIEASVLLPKAQSSATIDLVANTQEYSLASNIIMLNLVRHTDNNWVLKQRPINQIMQRFSNSTGTPQEYYVWGGVIGFHPTPSANDTAGVKYWYTKTLPKLVLSGAVTGEVTTSEVPEEFHWVLERGAEMFCHEMVDDADRQRIAERRFEEGIELIKKKYSSFTQDFDTEIYPDDTLEGGTSWNFNPYAS